jgi:hypothetical protein
MGARSQRAWRKGGGALALLAALALVLANAIVPPAARATGPADPLAALLDICTAAGPSTDGSADGDVPTHARHGCGACLLVAGAAPAPTAAALPMPRARPSRAVAGPVPFPSRPARRRLRPPPTAPPSRI